MRAACGAVKVTRARVCVRGACAVARLTADQRGLRAAPLHRPLISAMRRPLSAGPAGPPLSLYIHIYMCVYVLLYVCILEAHYSQPKEGGMVT